MYTHTHTQIYTNSIYILSKLWEIVEDREAWHAAIHWVAKSWTWLSDWTTTTYTYTRLNHIAVHLKLTQHCTPTIPQLKKIIFLICAMGIIAVASQWAILKITGGVSGKESTYQCRTYKRHGFDPWVRKIPWRKAWQPIPVIFPGESHGQRSLAGFGPQGHKESSTTKQLSSWHILQTMPSTYQAQNKC